MPDGGPRIQGFDYRGVHQYSLTICIHDRRAVFVEPALVAEVLLQIQRAAGANEFAILAYCFMPDHLHLLVEGTSDGADLQRFIKYWKQKTGFDYARCTNRRLWQVGFFDHVLRSDESASRHAEYILGNPVRAGLARSVGEYPFAEVIGHVPRHGRGGLQASGGIPET